MWARTDSEGTENIPTGGLGRQLSEQEAITKRVLLVDDHNLFRDVLTILCEQHTGLDNNIQVGSLAEARRVLGDHNSNDFALAVVDLDLADAGGMELIGELRRAGTPVLALTTSRDSAERLARRSGPDWGEVLTTAASGKEILDAVRRIMGR
jgi:DNA-binding NarL/FixJ family response regulator